MDRKGRLWFNSIHRWQVNSFPDIMGLRKMQELNNKQEEVLIYLKQLAQYPGITLEVIIKKNQFILSRGFFSPAIDCGKRPLAGMNQRIRMALD